MIDEKLVTIYTLRVMNGMSGYRHTAMLQILLREMTLNFVLNQSFSKSVIFALDSFEDCKISQAKVRSGVKYGLLSLVLVQVEQHLRKPRLLPLELLKLFGTAPFHPKENNGCCVSCSP